MPIYGHNKTKTMVKSVLPSNARKQAKERKDGLHRYNRRTVNHHLRNLRGYASDVADEFEDDNYDYNYYAEPHRHNYGGWEDIVYFRRQADKLNHFETWAYYKTQHLDPADRFKKVASMLNGVLGTHAMSHLEFLKYDPLEQDVWRDNLPTQLRRQHYYNDWAVKRKAFRSRVAEAVASVARDDIKRAKFNEYLLKNSGNDIQIIVRWNYTLRVALNPDFPTYRHYPRYEEKVVHKGHRTLNGYHDIHKFLRDIFAATTIHPHLGYHPSWLKAVCQYFEIDTVPVLGQR